MYTNHLPTGGQSFGMRAVVGTELSYSTTGGQGAAPMEEGAVNDTVTLPGPFLDLLCVLRGRNVPSRPRRRVNPGGGNAHARSRIQPGVVTVAAHGRERRPLPLVRPPWMPRQNRNPRRIGHPPENVAVEDAGSLVGVTLPVGRSVTPGARCRLPVDYGLQCLPVVQPGHHSGADDEHRDSRNARLFISVAEGLLMGNSVSPGPESLPEVPLVQPDFARQFGQHANVPDVSALHEEGYEHAVVIVVAPAVFPGELVPLEGQVCVRLG
ncbi:MAG TPA: hypothetical protein VM452_06105 [Caulifigura sp.]|nr:hypothetical protein [Caulifigura sp.]